jgi:hypothetical protein
MDIETFKMTLYVCGCGYKTTHCGNAGKHKKMVPCGHTMTSDMTDFVSKSCFNSERTSDFMLKECLQREKMLIGERERLNNMVTQLQNANEKLKSYLAKMATSVDDIDIENELGDMPHTGIIYFITDRDVSDRGKIGRTKNTNIKKLKTRYSTFGCPSIICYLSTDIKSDEADLKKLMRDAGCMKSNAEMISNCNIAIGIFYEFMTSKLS